MGTTQFVNEIAAEEIPIFRKVQVQFTPKHPLTHLAVSNNNIVMAFANRSLNRKDQDLSPDNLEEIDINKVASGAKISNLFLDHSGRHLLISLKSSSVDGQAELLYLPKKSNRPRVCNKFKGSLVSAVAHSHDFASDTSTGPILLGTTRGLIIETELSSDDRMFSKEPELYYKQLFDIGKGQHVPVTGLEYHNVPNTTKYYVIATTPQRMYQLQGYVNNTSERPLLQHVFNNYLTKAARFLEFPSSLKYSTLSVYYTQQGKRRLPAHFGWLTEPGLYTGSIDPWEGDTDSVTVDCQLINPPNPPNPPDANKQSTNQTPESEQNLSKNALVTEFHVMLLYPDRVKGVCLLNEQVVFDDVYNPSHGKLVGIAHDQVKNVYWAFTDYAVFKYMVVNESRHIWKIYLQQGKFELATKHSSSQPDALNLILTKQAEKLFDEEKYVESAMHYAKTNTSFEEVTLKFMSIKDKNALKNYLKKKLESLKSSEKTQITLIVLWLLEIYQNKLGSLRESESELEKYSPAQAEFRAFLAQPRVEECIKNNKETVYGLLGSHGDTEHLVHLAKSLQDTEKVIQYNMRKGDYSGVLSLLVEQMVPQLFYDFSPVLLEEIPAQTVDAFIKLDRKLNPSKILPAIMVTTESQNPAVMVECIRYLEFSVNVLESRDEALHNLLLSLYVSEQPSKILPYLTARDKEPLVDVKYVLRLCLEAGLKQEGVHLLTLLEQHPQAMELALTIDIDLAVRCAGGNIFPNTHITLSEDTSKKLWLRVARHVVQEKNDIKQAMEFLTQCPSVKIEDILPFFPDFVTIDHFKSAIVESLQDYSKHITDLKAEMVEATESAQVIRDEISKAKSRYQFVRATDRCCSCGDLLLSREFYLFACCHRFHTDCLIEMVLPYVGQARRRRIGELQAILKQTTEETVSTFSGETKQEMAANELADLVAGECCYCGEIMIRDIDTPFIEDQHYDQVINDWL